MQSSLSFTCNGRVVETAIAPGESLLNVLRERLGLHSVKDGCAPQGQCGCCTILVDGAPRVACVTPVDPGRGSLGHDARGLRRSRSRRRIVRGNGRIAVRLLHAGHHHAIRRRACSPLRSRARRTPVSLHRLADRSRRSRRRRTDDPRSRRRRARVPSSKGVLPSASAMTSPWGSTLRRRLGSFRRVGRGARVDPRRHRGRRRGLGRRRVVARGAAPRRQGARTADDGRPASAAPRVSARVPARRRAPRDVVGRAGVPRTGRVVVRAGR